MARLRNDREVTVTVLVIDCPPNEALIIVVPAAIPVTLPLFSPRFSTVAMPLLSEVHVLLRVTSWDGVLLYGALTVR
jgi:hypothetical protein